MTDTDTTKADDGQAGVETHDNEGPPGVALAGCPGSHTNVRIQSYRAERHECNGEASAESVPSAGWRAVYYAMEVRVNAGR